MRYIDLTLPTMAENLALDEALLDEAEAADEPQETLRIWESSATAVVLGRSSRRALEVDETNCQRQGVEVFRRSSGGLSILTGPGCMMYSVVLSNLKRPELKSIPAAHQFVLGELRAGLANYLPGVEIQGTSDLVYEGQKFSGNSQRMKRHHLLYHGTLLYEFPLSLISECLLTPPRAPEYRAGRSHAEFVRNLPLARRDLVSAVQQSFLKTTLSGAEISESGTACDWPRERTAQLVKQRFTQVEWTNCF